MKAPVLNAYYGWPGEGKNMKLIASISCQLDARD